MRDKPVTLKQIAAVTGGKLSGDSNSPVTDVSHDSRRAVSGSLFAAVRGELFDAHKFIPQVIAQGALGVISELELPAEFQSEGKLPSAPFAWIQVDNIRRAMALAAAEVHHHPSRELQLVGITGTNGKTTTAYLVASIPEAAGEPVAMTGTVEYRLGAERHKAERTTPEATDMQRLLRRAVEIGCQTAVMEASSQAMDFHRCDALDYSVAVFSNLTRDHLDYHKTMENYWYAKQRLFDGRLGSRPRVSVINVDDRYGLELAERLEAEDLRVVRYAVRSDADVTARDAEFSLDGMRFNLKTRAGELEFHSPLVGPPHIYNTLALTSDNPRSEDPEKILADAEVGITKTAKPYRKIADRREAIHRAISEARGNDLVLIAGKGHEDYQIIGREVFHFDDKEVAREALRLRGFVDG